MPTSSSHDFGLRQTALTLQSELEKRPIRLITDLQSYLSIAPFTATVLGWPGASYIVAQASLVLENLWTLDTPIRPPDFSFVAAVAYEDPTTGRWTRRKLWENVGERLSYPVYTGEVLPATGVLLEFWTVENFTEEIELPSQWTLPLTALELPESFEDLVGSGTEVATLCLTHATTPSSLEEALEICQLL